MNTDLTTVREILARHDQAHLLTHLPATTEAIAAFAQQIDEIDFELLERLVDTWIHGNEHGRAHTSLTPPAVTPPYDPDDPACAEAVRAGHAAIAAGRVGFLLVAGGQGTRLGHDAPKGTYPIGPITGRSLFEYFADRIRWYDERFEVRPPWYIMVSELNEGATRDFFREHSYFGLSEDRVRFFTQATMPSVDESGKLMLEAPGIIARNPNGHGGVIPACVENGILDDAENRGVDTLHYFQVDNWAARLFDPYFLGLHANAESEFSAKICRKNDPQESSGVFCSADGKVRVVEYTEIDIYPELLNTLDDGTPELFAANVAMHLLDTRFLRRVYENFDQFPWHCSHKKIPFINDAGERVAPTEPNGYKFETFIFDALEYVDRPPVLLEIPRVGEFAPVKQREGDASPDGARASMNRYWSAWLDAAGIPYPDGVNIEINPRFACTQEEFVKRAKGRNFRFDGPVLIDPED